jgi:hypothetical protein
MRSDAGAGEGVHVCVRTATLDADTRLQAAPRGCAQRTTTRQAACSVQHATHGTRRATPDSQRGCPPQTRKRSIFLRAVGVGGERSTIESERNSRNARVRTMRTSPTTDVSRVRARRERAQPAGRASAFARISGSAWEHHGRLAPERTQSRTRGAPRVSESRNVLCSRPTLCRPTPPANHTQCDAQITPRVRRRTPKSAVCAVLRARRGVAWLAG